MPKTLHQNGARKNICTRVHTFRTLELDDKAINCWLHHTFIIENALLVHLAHQQSSAVCQFGKKAFFTLLLVGQLEDWHFCCTHFEPCNYRLNKVQGLYCTSSNVQSILILNTVLLNKTVKNYHCLSLFGLNIQNSPPNITETFLIIDALQKGVCEKKTICCQ